MGFCDSNERYIINRVVEGSRVLLVQFTALLARAGGGKGLDDELAPVLAVSAPLNPFIISSFSKQIFILLILSLIDKNNLNDLFQTLLFDI